MATPSNGSASAPVVPAPWQNSVEPSITDSVPPTVNAWPDPPVSDSVAPAVTVTSATTATSTPSPTVIVAPSMSARASYLAAPPPGIA